jgi:hypothetical protein
LREWWHARRTAITQNIGRTSSSRAERHISEALDNCIRRAATFGTLASRAAEIGSILYRLFAIVANTNRVNAVLECSI